MDRKTVAVLFGGRSAEHEISIITALQAITALDTLHYRPLPVYVHPNGKWYQGEALLDKNFYKGMPETLSRVQEVVQLPDPAVGGLLPVSAEGTFSFKNRIPIDVYFMAFHGQFGEDGCVQGLLELADAAYTGCEVLPSALAMHKYHCKNLLQAHGIPVLPAAHILRTTAQQNLSDIITQIEKSPGLERYPLFVKPCNLGSSIGIDIANDAQGLCAALAKAFRYDDEALVEPCITNLMEINVAVVEGDPPQASVVEIPVATSQALTYEDKYLRGESKTGVSQGMASLSRHIDPKDLDPQIKDQVTNYALAAYQILGCAGVSRFDFIQDKATKKIYFNELNPIPGSFSFYLWEKCSPPILYTDVLDRLIRSAAQRKAARLSLQHNIGFKALK